MTAEELAELQLLLTARIVVSRLRGNRRDDHLDVAMHLLESLRTARKEGLENDWGNLSNMAFNSDYHDHRDIYGKVTSRVITATHHTVTFTYHN